MIPHILDLKSSGARPRVHGNGFLQLDLVPNGSERLHIWSDRLPAQTERTSIHDHVFALDSTVLTGRLIHIEYDAIPSHPGYGDWSVYRAERIPGQGNNTELRDTGERVTLRERSRYELTEGSRYTFPALELHDTEFEGLTATIMRKVGAPVDYGRPRVLVRADAEPDNNFDREGFDQEFLWDIIKDALREARAVNAS